MEVLKKVAGLTKAEWIDILTEYENKEHNLLCYLSNSFCSVYENEKTKKQIKNLAKNFLKKTKNSKFEVLLFSCVLFEQICKTSYVEQRQIRKDFLNYIINNF